MKNTKKIFVFSIVILILFIAAISIQLLKSFHSEDALTDDFLSSDTLLNIESINNSNYTKIDTSKEVQNEIQELLTELNLKRTDNTYTPLDADYRIASSSTPDDQLYLFVEENVIVFPVISSTGYKTKNNVNLIKNIDMLLK